MKNIVIILLLILLFVVGYVLMGRMDQFLYLNNLLPELREQKDPYRRKEREREARAAAPEETKEAVRESALSPEKKEPGARRSPNIHEPHRTVSAEWRGQSHLVGLTPHHRI